MNRLENTLLLLPLVLVYGCAANQLAVGTDLIIPNRRPFVDQPREAADRAQLDRPATPTDRHFQVPQRGTPFAEEQEREIRAQWRDLRGRVFSDTGARAAGDMPTISLIAAGESDIQFYGFGVTPEEREQFDKARAQRIDARVKRGTPGFREAMDAPMQDPRVGVLCAVTLPVCPLMLTMTAGVGWAGKHATERLSATIQEPRFIPEADGSRLATALRKRFTGASLEERTTRLAGDGYRPVTDEAAPVSRLVVRFTEVTLNYEGRRMSLMVTAQAQPLPSAGNDWPASKHTYRSAARPLSVWTADNDGLVLHEIETALDALAGSIWAAYGPARPASPR